MSGRQEFDRRGRRVALVIAGTALFWIAANVIGAALDMSHRLRALIDLVAGAGFIWAIWMIYGLWRDRQNHKE